VGANPVALRNALANELEQPRPVVSPISVTDISGVASKTFACSIRRLAWYRSGGIPNERLNARQK
jgi:hypothetical protein